ncbi:hypothetical protein Tco_0678211, partial [Tanacetum coccineum]
MTASFQMISHRGQLLNLHKVQIHTDRKSYDIELDVITRQDLLAEK